MSAIGAAAQVASNLLSSLNTWLLDQTLAAGKHLIFAGGGSGAVAATQLSFTANESKNFGVSSGLLHMRNDVSGGALLVGFDGTVAYSIHQNGSNFQVGGADPGAGSGKFWVQNSGVVQNRNAGTITLSVLLLSSSGGRLP